MAAAARTKSPKGNSLASGLGKKRTVKPKADPRDEQIAALQAKLDELVAQHGSHDLLADPQEPKAAPRKGRKSTRKSQPKAESDWEKGVTFTYVKKGGAESSFRITSAEGSRVLARNVGTGFASKFKLTTLDALRQTGFVYLDGDSKAAAKLRKS